MEVTGKHRLGDVVVRGAEAASDHHPIHPLERFVQRLGNRFRVVANDGCPLHRHAQAEEPLAEKARVAVLDEAAQHLVADGDDFRAGKAGVRVEHVGPLFVEAVRMNRLRLFYRPRREFAIDGPGQLR